MLLDHGLKVSQKARKTRRCSWGANDCTSSLLKLAVQRFKVPVTQVGSDTTNTKETLTRSQFQEEVTDPLSMYRARQSLYAAHADT